jgi:hypothetical protein
MLSRLLLFLVLTRFGMIQSPDTSMLQTTAIDTSVLCKNLFDNYLIDEQQNHNPEVAINSPHWDVEQAMAEAQGHEQQQDALYDLNRIPGLPPPYFSFSTGSPLSSHIADQLEPWNLNIDFTVRDFVFLFLSLY